MTNNRAKALEAFERWIDSAGCLEQKHFDNGDIRMELARNAETIREALSEPHQLTTIAAILQRWIDFDTDARNKEGLETTDDTHIMAPPTWPSHGQLKNWIATLSEPKWKTTDSAPKDGNEYLGWFPDLNERRVIWWCSAANFSAPLKGNADGFWNSSHHSVNQPTHWMHLPDAPTGEES